MGYTILVEPEAILDEHEVVSTVDSQSEIDGNSQPDIDGNPDDNVEDIGSLHLDLSDDEPELVACTYFRKLSASSNISACT